MEAGRSPRATVRRRGSPTRASSLFRFGIIDRVAKYVVGSLSARRTTDDQQVDHRSLGEFVTDVTAMVLHVDPDSLCDYTASSATPGGTCDSRIEYTAIHVSPEFGVQMTRTAMETRHSRSDWTRMGESVRTSSERSRRARTAPRVGAVIPQYRSRDQAIASLSAGRPRSAACPHGGPHGRLPRRRRRRARVSGGRS